MTNNKPTPGVSRGDRINNEGLERLEKQLARGVKIARPVLAQWIKRYGEPARQIIKKHGLYSSEFE